MLETKLKDVAEPSFSRHETFHPRFGWLHKAYSALTDPNIGSDVFLRDNATVTLGVGKNMVNAIRFWSYAFKLTIEYPKDPTSRANVASPTWEAQWLLNENGADPYLEDTASLWLLHWWLLAKPCHTPTWWVAFHAQSTSRFTTSELTETTLRHVRLAGWEPPVEASVTKDADCLTKMYARRREPTAGSGGSFEDLLDSPFRELGLLEPTGFGRNNAASRWHFTSNARTSLPPALVAYACLDYAARSEPLQSGSIALARLTNEPGGPGRAFRLREPEIAHALEEVAGEYPQMALVEGIGQRSLRFEGNPKDLAWDVLDGYYGNVRARASLPDREAWYATQPPGMLREMRRRGRTDLLDQPTLDRLAGALV
ncbi:uncharacterized protein DUF4007 [Micromonospora sp. M71_S20]|uniref:DUF4007 family protein n=1 Tax=Micromonospora sp. M71_S20 TaxID=592872 RepID=UPI000EAF62E7|nr:DUF4007 family protein [Micromonospora sp. M71_S20]RLK23837.1 uncharacterized protein DUF4007 [Micromonospora sp. M71_S20]